MMNDITIVTTIEPHVSHHTVLFCECDVWRHVIKSKKMVSWKQKMKDFDVNQVQAEAITPQSTFVGFASS